MEEKRLEYWLSLVWCIKMPQINSIRAQRKSHSFFVIQILFSCYSSKENIKLLSVLNVPRSFSFEAFEALY